MDLQINSLAHACKEEGGGQRESNEKYGSYTYRNLSLLWIETITHTAVGCAGTIVKPASV